MNKPTKVDRARGKNKSSKLKLDMGQGEKLKLDHVQLGMGSVSMGCVASVNFLPDELLVQILSLQAALTSVLSKRWRTLFAFRHDLDFDDSIFWHPEEGKRDSREFQVFCGSNFGFARRCPYKQVLT